MVNLTIASLSGPGFATNYPCSAEPPTASSINYGPGVFIANAVTAQLDATGNVCIFTLAATDIIVDVNAYLPGLGAGTRAIDVRVVDNHGNPFAVGQGSVMACPSEGFAVPCAALIGGTLSDAAGGSTIMLSGERGVRSDRHCHKHRLAKSLDRARRHRVPLLRSC